MEKKPAQPKSALSRLDRPNSSVPSVDRPWEDPEDRKAREVMAKRDTARHRVYHSVYEDMLN